MKRIIIACFVFVALTCSSSAYAGFSDKPPTKESLLKAWEQVQKGDSFTLKLDKTAEQNVYDFETNFFPYKGKLTILNLVIDTGGGYFYEDEDSGDKDTYTGVVELELTGVDSAFKEKFPYSYSRWARHNRLIYDEHTAKWYTREDWAGYKKLLSAVQDKSDSVAPSGNQQGVAQQSTAQRTITTDWSPIIFLFVIFLAGWLISLPSMRRRKKLQGEYKQRVDESVSLSRASVEDQKVLIELQKEILAVLKAKA